MGFTLLGLLLLVHADSFPVLLLAAALVGIGSSVFHPESPRAWRGMASGGRHGFAQSLFQVGGNVGSAIGPLLAAFIVVPRGQGSIAWFSLVALLAIIVLCRVGAWYSAHRAGRTRPSRGGDMRADLRCRRDRRRARRAAGADLLEVLLHGQPQQLLHLLPDRAVRRVGAARADLSVRLPRRGRRSGTFVGGPIGDRFGRKRVIWFSILGVAALHAGAALRRPVLDGRADGRRSALILSSAFSAIVVYAQELMPGQVGMISGLFFGFAFGMGGVGAAVLGELADIWGIVTVFKIVSFLPLIGLITVFLPNVERRPARA